MTDHLRHYSKNIPYIIGYRYFHDQKLDISKKYFLTSVAEGKHVAPSYYMLAHISGVLEKDLSKAQDLFDKAIAHDPEYTSGYYGRARVAIEGNRIEHALDDLEEAVLKREGHAHCYDINRIGESDMGWNQRIFTNPRFEIIRKHCKKQEEILRIGR